MTQRAYLQRVTVAVLFTGLLFGCSAPIRETPQPPPRRLILGLDGVAFHLFKTLQNGGYFRDFQPAAPMVASFPSISDPNWARIFRTSVSDGYTKSHFNETVATPAGKGQVVGGLIDHLRSPTDYEKRFDFKAEGFWQHVATMTWIQTSALYWLDSLEEQFFNTRGKDTFFAFIMNTDLISHIEGEKALMKYLVTVDNRIEKMRKTYRKKFGSDFEVVLISDHGNSYSEPHMIQFQEPLTKLGWHFSESLAAEKDVVFVAPEILSFGAFYCSTKKAVALAKDFSAVSGVDIVAVETQPHVIDFYQDATKNHSQVTVDPKSQTLRYKVLSGKDPLNQMSFFQSREAPSGHLTFERYFQLSADAEYPHALVRLWEAFHVNSRLPAQVLVSTHVGYAFSNPTLELITTLKGLRSLHGSLRKEESQGIFVSTHTVLPTIRPQDFGEIYSLEDFGKSPASK